MANKTWTEIDAWLSDENKKHWYIEIQHIPRDYLEFAWNVRGYIKEYSGKIKLNEGVGTGIQECLTDFINNNGD